MRIVFRIIFEAIGGALFIGLGPALILIIHHWS
jgi:hypothetical protein